jgi:hemerythrin-like domain-containing protein
MHEPNIISESDGGCEYWVSGSLGGVRRAPVTFASGRHPNTRTVMNEKLVRRSILLGGIGLGASTLTGQTRSRLEHKKSDEQEDVSPAEDLMREHGVLKRVLLVYEEAAARLEANKDLPDDVIPAGAKLIRGFIEEYHEKLEEDYLFPRFRKAGQQLELVNTLEQQHKAGRRVTDSILQLSRAKAKDVSHRKELATGLRSFVRMYAPHEAREDTVLFPAFPKIVSQNEYDSLGEEFEKKEHQLFGEDGFEKNVEIVAGLEKKLGIYDLSQFTPGK